MARGVRKSPLEKLQIELLEVQNSIQQYESCLDTMRLRETQLLEKIQLEECRELSHLIKEHGLSIDDLKEIVNSNMIGMEQSA